VNRPSDRVFGASGSSAFYRAEALHRVGAYDPGFGSYYEDVDLAFRLRWAGYGCVFAPTCRILHEVSASYDHASPALQRRMARNAEVLFWTNLPAAWLGIAIAPHVAFLIAQGLWRLARGRARPFLLGKLDALRDWPELRRRRALRAHLAASPVAPPHFPIQLICLLFVVQKCNAHHPSRHPTSHFRSHPRSATISTVPAHASCGGSRPADSKEAHTG
jgi:hypothetical protein